MVDILHLIDTYRIGGPGKTIINSARFIDREAYRIHVASFTASDNALNEFAQAVRARRIPYLELRERGRIDVRHVNVLRGYIRRKNIRIVHTHGYRADVIGYVATRGVRQCAVVTTHHGWIRNTWRQAAWAKVAILLARAFDGIEVVASSLLEDLPEGIRLSDRVVTVHNAVVLEDYQATGQRDRLRRAMGIDGQAKVVGVIGRLSLEKGCLDALDAAQLVARAVDRVWFVFAGEGPLREAMKERAAELGLERVLLLGHRDARDIYEVIDVLLSPSHTEGLSNVILEALAFGRPVLATRVGGNQDIVEDGVSGLLVDPCQPRELAARLAVMLANDTLRTRLVEGGRARVESAFDFRSRMRREEAFYDRILALAAR